MRELEHLKELYLDEIKKITKKGELTPADSEAARKALEAIEKINDICCDEEDAGYSERGYRSHRSYAYRMPEMYPVYANDYQMMYPYSERRGRSATTGRYISRNDGSSVDKMIRKLEQIKSEAPDHETMIAIDNVISKLEDY